MRAFHIAEISAEETYPLRSLVLRNRDLNIPCPFEGDSDTTTKHFACFRENEIIAVGSFYQQKNDLLGDRQMVQLRGMATDPNFTNKGYGRGLMNFTIDYFRKGDLDLIWCNAREVAFGFYKNLGFLKMGENFLISEIGVHSVMYLKLN